MGAGNGQHNNRDGGVGDKGGDSKPYVPGQYKQKMRARKEERRDVMPNNTWSERSPRTDRSFRSEKYSSYHSQLQ